LQASRAWSHFQLSRQWMARTTRLCPKRFLSKERKRRHRGKISNNFDAVGPFD